MDSEATLGAVRTIQKRPRRILGVVWHYFLLLLVAGLLLLGWMLSSSIDAHNRRVRSSLNGGRMAKGLEIGIKGYQTEYHRYPLAAGRSDDKAFEAKGTPLKCLMGEDAEHNPRKVRFYDPPLARNGKGGYFIDGAGVPLLVDDYGNLFWICIDYDNDGVIGNPAAGYRNEPASLSSGVLIYSAGEDGNLSTWKDNVTSWQLTP